MKERLAKLRARRDINKATAFILVTNKSSTIFGEFKGMNTVHVLSALKSLQQELKTVTKNFENNIGKEK